jgi:hypothetical protein
MSSLKPPMDAGKLLAALGASFRARSFFPSL